MHVDSVRVAYTGILQQVEELRKGEGARVALRTLVI
jgi:hypothetical protein